MAFSPSSVVVSPVDVLHTQIDDMKRIIERNTNRNYLLNHAMETVNTFDSVTRDSIYDNIVKCFDGEKDTVNSSLGSENNLVNIITLTKSIDKILDGKVFLGRVLVRAIRLEDHIYFVMEDPDGERAIQLVLYDTSYDFGALKVDTLVAVMNPCFKTSLEGNFALWSDNPNDVIILNEGFLKILKIFSKLDWKVLFKSKSYCETSDDYPEKSKEEKVREAVLSLKNRGNKYFGAKNYHSAISSYTKGLYFCTYDPDLLSNRALCYLKLENYKDAFKDASLVLEKNPGRVKAIFRAAKAHIGLKQYGEAKIFLEEHLRTVDVKENLVELLKNIKEYIAQRDFGQYDMTKMFVSTGKYVELDVADFVRLVKIADCGLKGRGLTVTEDVEPGQLLLSVKAFAIYFTKTSSKGLDHSSIVNSWESEHTLLNMIIEKVTKHPETLKELYGLSAGKELGYLNPDKDDCTKVDVKRIGGVFIVNGFGTDVKDGHFKGLWILPSYINHDCFNCNAGAAVFGDIFQVRCFKPIKAGEEIVISYREHASTSWHQRNDFVCRCDLCRYESKEPANRCAERNALLDQFQNGQFRHPSEISNIIKKIRKISKDSPFVDHYIALPQFKLANLTADKNGINKGIHAYEEFLRDWPKYGGYLPPFLLRASLYLFKLYVEKGDKVNGKKWGHEFKEFVKLNYGSCEDSLLNAISPGIVEKISILDI